MKKSFIAGLLTGLSGALLLFTVIGAIYVFTINNGKVEFIEKENTVQGVQAAEKKETSYSEIVEKLSFLEMLVDNYYLEEVNQTEFADGIYKGFIASLDDPYSTYYTKDEYKALMESSSGVYCGIGATVSQDAKTGVITIVKPFVTGPAYKAGMRPEDILYMVDGEEVTGVDISEVVSRMKGIEGTKVKVSVIREGEEKPLEFVITRQKIEVPTIEHKMLQDKIGYVIISEFDEITVTQFKQAIDQLEKDGMKGLVVDVRNNPGGLLDSVVKILDRLLPKGLVVYTEDKYGNRVEENAKDATRIKVPMTVLINGNSASASEIFAGTIQDYNAGTVVGTTSFGKGIVQKVIPISDGTAVKLTISKYYTPKGRNIHGSGIKPDIEVDLKEELKKEVTIPTDQDNQLQEAIKILKKKMK